MKPRISTICPTCATSKERRWYSTYSHPFGYGSNIPPHIHIRQWPDDQPHRLPRSTHIDSPTTRGFIVRVVHSCHSMMSYDGVAGSSSPIRTSAACFMTQVGESIETREGWPLWTFIHLSKVSPLKNLVYFTQTKTPCWEIRRSACVSCSHWLRSCRHTREVASAVVAASAVCFTNSSRNVS